MEGNQPKLRWFNLQWEKCWPEEQGNTYRKEKRAIVWMQTHQDYYQDIGGNDSYSSWRTGSEIVCGLPNRRDNKQIPYGPGMIKNDMETNASLDHWHVDLVASTPGRSQSIRDANQTNKTPGNSREFVGSPIKGFWSLEEKQKWCPVRKLMQDLWKKMSYLKGSWENIGMRVLQNHSPHRRGIM